MARRKHRRYSPEFRAEAIRLVEHTDDAVSTIARELGVNEATLRHWVTRARPAPREPLTEDERSELGRLRRENRQLQMERDILKKATAFFARQSE